MTVKKRNLIIMLVAILSIFSIVMINQQFKIDPNIDEKYTQLITDIDEHLEIVNNKYVYDYEVVKDLVYNFDVRSMNKKYDQNYTKASLLEEMIKSIDEYRVSAKPWNIEIDSIKAW